MAKAKTTVTLRYPFSGDTYIAEGPYRIRVEKGPTWGYFDDRGRWLQEGTLRMADPTFCRFLSSSWMVENNPARWGLPPLPTAKKVAAKKVAPKKAAPKAVKKAAKTTPKTGRKK